MILATINPWLALYVCLGAFLIACAWTAISRPLVPTRAAVDRHEATPM